MGKPSWSGNPRSTIITKKTLQFDDFKNYIRVKNCINHRLSSFYEEQIHRKLKLNGFINKRKSDSAC